MDAPQTPAPMTPPPPMPASSGSRKKHWRIFWSAILVAVVIVGAGYALLPGRFPHITLPVTPTGSFILALNAPIKDAQGIPYSGTVLYNPVSDTYSYIATEDGGTVMPIGPSAFSEGPYYLATRASASSTDLVLYDRSTLSIARVVKQLAPHVAVTSAVWAPDGKTFAYTLAGEGLPALTVGSLSATTTRTFGFNVPIGFSPDSSKILVRGTPTPQIINVADGTITPTTGTAFVDSQVPYTLSPSGKYLVVTSGTQIEWYAIDWNKASITSVGRIALVSPVSNAVFMPDDTLLVQMKGSNITQLYAAQQNGSVESAGVAKLSLPEGAHILHIVSP